MIGIGLDITRAGQTVSFSPENLRRGSRDVRDLTVRPNRLYSDTAGTTPIAGPGAEVAAMRDSRGVLVATQATAAARPKYAVQPAVGVRNRLRNNRGDGAVVGVLGSGGVLPTGMTISGIAAGSVEVASIAAKNGRPNTRLRINGTPTGDIEVRFGDFQDFPALAGQTWTGSVWAQMTAGSMANFTEARTAITTFTTAGAFVNGGTTNFQSTIGDDLRRSTTLLLSGGTIAFARTLIQLTWTSGAVDITLDISAQQFEQAGAATDVQIVGADGFDVTESGVRSLDVLRPDGIDDSMTLASAFAPTGAYTLAAAHALNVGGRIFGNAAISNVQFRAISATEFELRADSPSNRFFATGLASVTKKVDLARASTATAGQFFRNGVEATPARTGNLIPLNADGFTHLFREFAVFSAGAYYGGVMIDEGDTPLTDAERLMTQRYLANKGGITL